MLLILALLLSTSLAARSQEITVFAAASLTDALRNLVGPYQKATGDRVFFNFAASSVLERQIEEGAPADIFFSADEAKMDLLEKQGMILKDTRVSRLSNTLVVVVHKGSALAIHSPADLAGTNVARVALADPRAVPAGIYAKEYLEKQHLWRAVEPKVVPTENVRGALAAVESGNVEVGMVYRTDAAISKLVTVAYQVPRTAGPPISYPVAVVRDSKHVEAARRFLHYLNSDEAAKVFEKYGFIVLR